VGAVAAAAVAAAVVTAAAAAVAVVTAVAAGAPSRGGRVEGGEGVVDILFLFSDICFYILK